MCNGKLSAVVQGNRKTNQQSAGVSSERFVHAYRAWPVALSKGGAVGLLKEVCRQKAAYQRNAKRLQCCPARFGLAAAEGLPLFSKLSGRPWL